MASAIIDNITRVRERMAAACRRAGRRAEDVRLVAISKTVPPERIRDAYEAGLREFGENRVQEARAKRAALADLPITWHLVGHLQSNKARAACELFDRIDSIDSARLAQKLDAALLPGAADGEASRDPTGANEAGAVRSPGRLPVLIEINLGGEAAKSGVEESAALELARQVGRLATLELRGLMLVPPFFEDPAAARPYFFRLRELAKVIDSARLPGVRMDELSMGMSHDFETAIEEGATQVRVGTAIFGPRS
ncbi:MAG TPA: YggS family pyridoxal phosphate enzyme [Terriglobia bacterium]|nr:YggS family pyridoxal phosphate enzyme [Terriglobia bacterium]